MFISYLFEALLHLKASSDASSQLPSPLGFDLRWPIIPRMGGYLMQASENAMHHAVNHQIDFSTLPSSILTFSILPYAATYSSRSLSHADPFEALPILRDYRQLLLSAHLGMGEVMKRIESSVTDPQWRDVSETTRAWGMSNVDHEIDWAALAGLFDPSNHLWSDPVNTTWLDMGLN